MLLSTQTYNVFRRFGEDKGIAMFAEAGFDALDFSGFDIGEPDDPLTTADIETYAKDLRARTEACGLHYNQAHAPFIGWKDGDDAYNNLMLARTERAIRIAGLLGADCCVVHPFARPGGGEAQKRFNLDFYHRLEKTALEAGTKIALENLWEYSRKRGCFVPNVCALGTDLADYLDALNPDAFTGCLDLGHSALVGEEPETAVRALGNRRLTALHVHDNNYHDDQHDIPFSYGCGIDWNAVTQALGEIDYKGDLTFEADNFLDRLDDALILPALTYLAAVGRFLIAKIDAARPNIIKF